MHIKREQKGAFFNGNESVLYMLKMNLLYRRIMFEVLGIDEAIYKNSLLKCVSRLDEWNGILKGFLSKLSLYHYFRQLDGQPPFSFGRRCAHGYNLYPALQGGGWERRYPDNGGTL